LFRGANGSVTLSDWGIFARLEAFFDVQVKLCPVQGRNIRWIAIEAKTEVDD